ncbi:MAG: metalloregulator ArsR/SmtB family transcription factor [Spirochaetota bacterium]
MSRYEAAFSALGDETRLRLARVLVEADLALCLPELVDIVRRPQYAVSRAMAQLVRAGLVSEERRGKLRFYRLSDDAFSKRVFEAVGAIPIDDLDWMHDRDRLRWRLDLRQDDACVVTYTAGYSPREYTSRGDTMGSSGKKRVLFICVHNSARSQMAEEYLRHFAEDLFEVESAGLEPGTLNPVVVKAMADDGIDISRKTTQSVVDLYRAGRTYSYVITVCSREAEENCPVFPGPVRRLSWPFPDPSQFTGTEAEVLAETVEVRDLIKEEVRQFVENYRAQRDKPRVLAICIHNSARSQMTEEFIRRAAGDRLEVVSAGIEPGSLNPTVVELLKEDDIDIEGKQTRSVFDLHENGERFDYVIAVCDKEAAEACPIFPAERRRLHWPFPDPSKAEGSLEERLAYIRPIRDEIREKSYAFVREVLESVEPRF